MATHPVADAAIAACRAELPGLGPVRLELFTGAPDIRERDGESKDGRLDGWADPDGTIHVRAELSPSAMAFVVRHEIAHTITYATVMHRAHLAPLDGLLARRRQIYSDDEALADRFARNDPTARAELQAILASGDQPMFRIVAEPSAAATRPASNGFARWQAFRSRYDAGSAIVRWYFPPATRAPRPPRTDDDVARLRDGLRQRRQDLQTAAVRAGIDPIGAMVGDPVEAQWVIDQRWVQEQIDKRQRYYATRIKPLLEAGALDLDIGS